MLWQYFTGGAVLLGVIASNARAENQTEILWMRIVTEFDACSTFKTDNTRACATEKWRITVNSAGWIASGTGTVGKTRVMNMEASCDNGTYRSITNGGPAWIGKCVLTGTAARLCFHLTGGGGPKEAFSRVDVQQCFDIAGPSCQVEVNGVMIGQGETVLAVKEQKSCTVE